ncbi:hypothetical protein BGY98DRAFT_1012658 [Russula aff. rugulosa BPL654]|nr:hypothetical protein BGY98DRAFT_1012658 [Russula aff. rugulosa BPL654]
MAPPEGHVNVVAPAIPAQSLTTLYRRPVLRLWGFPRPVTCHVFTNPFRLSESVLVSVVGKLHNPISPAHLAVLCELLRELDLLQRHAGPWLQVIGLPIALVKLLAGLHSVTSSAPLLTELHPCALRRRPISSPTLSSSAPCSRHHRVSSPLAGSTTVSSTSASVSASSMPKTTHEAALAPPSPDN